MVMLTALFGHPSDIDVFEDHYLNTHTPLVQAIPGLQRFDRARVVATPDGSDPAYYRIADLWFESMEQLQSGLGSPEGQAASQDLQNFASGGVTLLISEV